jgi:hypothetical protein
VNWLLCGAVLSSFLLKFDSKGFGFFDAAVQLFEQGRHLKWDLRSHRASARYRMAMFSRCSKQDMLGAASAPHPHARREAVAGTHGKHRSGMSRRPTMRNPASWRRWSVAPIRRRGRGIRGREGDCHVYAPEAGATGGADTPVPEGRATGLRGDVAQQGPDVVARDGSTGGLTMTFQQFMRTLVFVRDEQTGELRPPVLHPEEVRIVEAMDALDPATGHRSHKPRTAADRGN